MSHYCVAVFSDEPDGFDELLIPYNEEDEQYQIFYPMTEDEIRKEYDSFKELNPSYDYKQFLDCRGYEMNEGQRGYWYNPNAKYDWYSLDARYPYPLKSPKDYPRKKDYDYNAKPRDLTPYAFVTPDGEWHAPGEIGWFATSDDTEESRARYDEEWEEYINNDDNPYVSFVDMHI